MVYYKQNRLINNRIPFNNLTATSNTCNLIFVLKYLSIYIFLFTYLPAASVSAGLTCALHSRVAHFQMLRIFGTGESAVCQNTVANLFPEKDCNLRGFHECFKKIPVAIPDTQFSALSAFTYTIDELRFNGTSMTLLGRSIYDFCSRRYDSVRAEVYGGSDKYAASGCFKAAYIFNLLQNYGVTDANFKKVGFKREAKGYNLGWSLGYMINATNAIPEADPYPALIPTPWFAFVVILFSIALGIGVFACFVSRRRNQRLAQANSEKDEKEELTLKETAA